MKTMQAFICAALSISFLGSAEVATAEPTSGWTCEIGECDLNWAPAIDSYSPLSCVTEQRNFFIEEIKNATSGAHSGSFNFIGDLVNVDPGVQTLDNFHTASLKRSYLKDMVFTLRASDSVADVSLEILDANGNALGKQHQVDANQTVVIWSHDVDPVSAPRQEIQFEIQGVAVTGAEGDENLEAPKLWVNVTGTRCITL